MDFSYEVRSVYFIFRISYDATRRTRPSRRTRIRTWWTTGSGTYTTAASLAPITTAAPPPTTSAGQCSPYSCSSAPPHSLHTGRKVVEIWCHIMSNVRFAFRLDQQCHIINYVCPLLSDIADHGIDCAVGSRDSRSSFRPWPDPETCDMQQWT